MQLTNEISITIHLLSKLKELGFEDDYYRNDAYYGFTDKQAMKTEGEIIYPKLWICEDIQEDRENPEDKNFIFCPSDNEKDCFQCDSEKDLIVFLTNFRQNELLKDEILCLNSTIEETKDFFLYLGIGEDTFLQEIVHGTKEQRQEIARRIKHSNVIQSIQNLINESGVL